MNENTTSPSKARSEEHFPMKMIPVSHTHHYSLRNHSMRFECDECGRSIRQNLNYLGRKSLYCIGIKTFKQSEKSLSQPKTNNLKSMFRGI
jgi:hypothetical protein